MPQVFNFMQNQKSSINSLEWFANYYVGKSILIGVTYYDHDGNFIEQKQVHGVIKSIDPESIRITLKGAHEGKSWSLPPDFDAIKEARQGTYILKSTGEEVSTDLISTWVLTLPPGEKVPRDFEDAGGFQRK